MSTCENKKTKELKRLLAFQSACNDCPQSKLIQPEPPAPDGLFPENKLGIEITEYALEQGQNGSLPRQQETVRQRITARAQELYETELAKHLQVSIHWTNFASCPVGPEEEQIAERIKWHVFENTSIQLQACRLSWEDLNEPLFSKYGIEISIFPISDIGKSCWSSSACFCFPPEPMRVQKVLDEKESKISKYRKICDTVWLLIVANREFFSSQFTPDSRLSETQFKTSFDRVFLLEEPQNTVHEFQVDR